MAGDLARALALCQQADLDRLPGPHVLDPSMALSPPLSRRSTAGGTTAAMTTLLP